MSSFVDRMLIFIVAASFFLVGCGGNMSTTLISFEFKAKDGQVQVSEVKEQVIATPEVIERSANVASVTRVTDFGGSSPRIGGLSLKPDGKDLVFHVRNDEGYDNLWAIGTTGGSMKRITTGHYYDLDPTFSADGRQLYFSSNRIGFRWKLWRVNYGKAGGLTQLTQTQSQDSRPDANASGDVAFTSRIPGAIEDQVWVIDGEDRLFTQLLEGSGPAWSPDGTKIAFERGESGLRMRQIWIVGAGGGGVTQLTDSRNDNINPAWSLDGTRIAFSSNRGKDQSGDYNHDIWVVNSDGTDLTQLTTNGSYDYQPCWGPDGKFIYFLSNRGGSWDVWRMTLSE